MAITNAVASVAVRDLSSAVAWYEDLFGRPADSTPTSGLAEWTFDLGGRLQIYQLPERAGAGSFTLAVSSVSEQIAHLAKFNLDTSQSGSSSKMKTLMITDPDGNHIAFAEAIDASVAAQGRGHRVALPS
jgi:hypothetical protein